MIVTVSLEWSIRCPKCQAVLVTAYGQRAAFDETRQVGRLNVGQMRKSAHSCRDCGWTSPPGFAPLPFELEHCAYLSRFA